jgi:predicted MPP superfamily phosphohydrolase
VSGPRRRRGERWEARHPVLVVVEVMAIGIAGALLGVLVAGSVTRGVGPFQADLSFRPSASGGTTVAVPPLGELLLDTHDGPVRLEVGIARLRDDAVRAIAADPGSLAGLGAEVDRDLRAGVIDLVLRTALVTSLGGAALGFLVFRSPRRTLQATGAGLAALAAVAAGTALTVDRDALKEPRFTGLLASAPTAVGDVRDIVERFDAYTLQLGRLVTNVTRLYDVTSRLPSFQATDDTVRVLHVSDLHLNPGAFDIISSVVEQFGVDLIVDTGDLTDFGSAAETRYVEQIGGLGVPYVYVRGNHDSALTQATVAAQSGAVVLDGPEVVEVAGLRLLGAGDPRFTPDKTTRDDDAPVSVLTGVGRTLARSVDTAPEPPHLVAVHDRAMAEPLLGRTPVVLAGHAHRRIVTTEEGTLVMVQGSTGGAGLRALEGEEPTPVTLTVLYVDPADGRLQAYDDITLGGLGTTDARIARTVVDADVVPERAPSPGPTGSPSPTP